MREFLIKVKNDKNYYNPQKIFVEGSSCLGKYIKFNVISVRYFCKKYLDVVKTSMYEDQMVRQLVFRDFYYYSNVNYPNVDLDKYVFGKGKNWKFNKKFYNKKKLDDWKNGRTGVPLIDAIMTKLNITGDISNRQRMIVASFLVNNLKQNWKDGEQYFAKTLVDYDPIQNASGWQQVAFKQQVFSPDQQQKKYDPKREFVKKWLEKNAYYI